VAALKALKARQAAERLAAGEAYERTGYVAADELGRPVHPEWYTGEFHRVSDRANVRRIQHRYIKPATPRLNGKVERSHRIDAEEFYRLLDGVMIDDTKLFNDKLTEWENFYNYHRPHGGPGGQTPYERLKQKTQTSVK